MEITHLLSPTKVNWTINVHISVRIWSSKRDDSIGLLNWCNLHSAGHSIAYMYVVLRPKVGNSIFKGQLISHSVCFLVIQGLINWFCWKIACLFRPFAVRRIHLVASLRLSQDKPLRIGNISRKSNLLYKMYYFSSWDATSEGGRSNRVMCVIIRR